MKKTLFLLLCTVQFYGQTSTGQEQSFPYGIVNESLQTITTPTYIGTFGTDGTQGKIPSALIAKTASVQDSLNKKLNLPTGFLQGLQLSINADPTKFNIAAGYYVVTDFTNLVQPVVKIINYAGATGLTPAYLATANSTYVALDINGNVVSSAAPFTNADRRTLAIVGNVVHSNNTTINVTNEIKAPIVASTNQLHDFMRAIGFLNEEGNIYSPNGANLHINKSAGKISALGINPHDYLNPNQLSIPSQTDITFAYRLPNGTQLADTQNLDPNNYSNAGVLTTVPTGNSWTINRFYLFPSGIMRAMHGQAVYGSYADALSALRTENFVVEQNISENSIFRTYVIVKRGTTDLQAAVTAGTCSFHAVDKFNNVIGNSSIALNYTNIIAALGFTPENVANKQNSLTVDGTGAKYPTVDAINKVINFITPEQFGAVGDGITDDTVAIKNAISSLIPFSSIVFSKRVYKISATEVSPILFDIDNISIIGNGAEILNTASSSIGVFKVSGENIIIDKFIFNGNNTSLNTFLVGDTAKNVSVTNCEFKNQIQQTGDLTFSVGIMVSNGSENISISDSYVHNIDASITGISRGILAGGYGTTETHFKNLSIIRCVFETITPSTDGDGIVLQPDDLTQDIDSRVSDCTFNLGSKRAVKIMGNSVTVNNNIITLPASGGYSAISVYANGCKVVNNIIKGGYSDTGIEIGVAGTIGSNSLIDGNTISMTSQTFNDGVRVFGAPTDLIITNNLISTVRNGINFTSSGQRAVVNGNLISSTTQSGIINTGTGGLYFNNVNTQGNNFKTITQYTIRNVDGLNWSSIGNTSDGSGFGSHTSLIKRTNAFSNFIANQPIIGTSNVAPVAGDWIKGDFIQNTNPNAYGVLGWQCTASGTPGSWSPVQSTAEKSSTANRPTKTTMGVATDQEWRGTMYFDTSLSAEGTPIWWSGVQWVDILNDPKLTGTTNISTTPTTSAGTYDILTRNTSTGVVEKIASASGSYTPTLTNTTNVSSSTLNAAYYVRNGNIVTVTIAVQLTLTATTETVFTFSLPISGATVVNGIGQGNMTSGGGAVNGYGIVDITNSTTAQLRMGSPAVLGSGSGIANIMFTYSL